MSYAYLKTRVKSSDFVISASKNSTCELTKYTVVLFTPNKPLKTNTLDSISRTVMKTEVKSHYFERYKHFSTFFVYKIKEFIYTASEDDGP